MSSAATVEIRPDRLPPTPAEIDAFLERFVSGRLCTASLNDCSPRHSSASVGGDIGSTWRGTRSRRDLRGIFPYPHAWRYRDYVIDAVNADVPFDRFVTRADRGRLASRFDCRQERDRLLIATGFLALGVKDVNQRFKVRFVMDNVDDQIDTVTRSVLGADSDVRRCHDHKFDPIPTTDYYALAGIFTSTDNCAGLRNKMGGGGLDILRSVDAR